MPSRQKYHRPTPIASTAQEWREIESLIDEHIKQIIGFEDPKSATALLGLLYVLCDEDFDALDRSVAAHHAIRTAFLYSDVSETALRNHLDTMRPPRKLRAIRSA